MGLSSTLVGRLGIAGATALLAGSAMLVDAGVQALTAPAFADSGQFELFCTGSPVGNIALNDVVISGSLSPASPAAGQQFSLVGVQAQVPVPADVTVISAYAAQSRSSSPNGHFWAASRNSASTSGSESS